MFVLPPPPQYQGVSPYGNPGVPVSIVPVLETTNTLSHPTGVEYQLLAGEGTYILKDDLHLATPQPHPSEPPVVTYNPLATAVVPPTAGTRLSLVTIAPRKTKPYLHKPKSFSSIRHLAGLTHGSKDEQTQRRGSGDSDVYQRTSENSSTQASGRASNGVKSSENGTTPAFGEGNASLLPPTGKDSHKRRKPKNNIVKSNSSFVSRVIPHEHLSKRLQERNPEGLYAFANINRAFHWLDLSSPNKAEQLTKVLFARAHALCHDVNDVTKSPNNLDVVIGFSTGDIIWYEPMSQKYTRLNKHAVINKSPISEIRWIPGSENLFLAAHADGSLVVYDKEKEDAPFLPEETPSASNEVMPLRVTKSVKSANQKFNPVACWKLSNQQINAFAFSPDYQHLAVVLEDGTLRVIDYLNEELLDVYSSYYGGLISVCWSPDGKYILTGGQDDLVSIWSLAERRIVARCEGHSSWVTGVAFDPWRCDERNYRFGSVGEDCKLLLWDFSASMLHRPKAASIRHRGSISSHFGAPNLGRSRAESGATGRFRSSSNVTSSTADEPSAPHHDVEPRAQTARLPPVMSKTVHPHPLCWLEFQENCIITSCQGGHIRTWNRPDK